MIKYKESVVESNCRWSICYQRISNICVTMILKMPPT